MAQQKSIRLPKIRELLKNQRVITLIQVLLVAAIAINVLSVVYQQRAKYFSQNYWKNFPALEKVFLSSQYVNKHPKGFIPDEIAFSYAGGKLIQGTNPVLVVPDAPPLGKYIIGFSTTIFNNDSTLILVAGILALICLYLLSFQILSNRFLALIPPLIFSSEPMFKNQLIYTPLLDLFQSVFLLMALYFFNKGLVKKKFIFSFFLASVFLGLFISTKFFVSGITIVFAWFLVLLFKRDIRRMLYLSLTLPVSVFILLASYVRVFAFGYTLSKFLGIQKWIFLYHKSQLILPLSVWPLLLFNKWYVWFGNKPYITDSQWDILWPVATIISILTIILYLFKKIPKNGGVEVLMMWFIIYMMFLSMGQVFSRYLIIMIPVLYIISIYGIVSLYKIYKK